MTEFKKILVIRMSGIGDIIFTLPAVNMIKDNFPDCHITYLTKKRFAELLQGFPGVDRVIAIDSDLYHSKNLLKMIGNAFKTTSELRKEKYELVIDFHGLVKTAILTGLSGANASWGFVRKKTLSYFYDIGMKKTSIHRIDLNCLLLEKGGLKPFRVKNCFNLPKSDLIKAEELFKQWRFTTAKKTVFIQPFTNYARKNWPLENYISLADYLNSQGVQVVFGGGPRDQEKLIGLTDRFPVAAGKASLLTSAGLIQLSDLMIGGDTGLGHLAVALCKKVLMVMRGGISREKFSPYSHPEWLLTPVASEDIKEIKLDEVINLASKMLKD